MTATTLWVVGTNALLAVLFFLIAGSSGLDDPWFYLSVGMIACLAIGIVLEMRGSRWSSRWNVGLFVAVSLAALLNATLVPPLIHDSEYAKGSSLVFVFFGVPALFMAVLNFFAFRRERRLKAA